MNITRRNILAGSLAVTAATLGLQACGKDSSPGGGGTANVTFGYIPDFNGTSLLAIANDQKLWDKHGVKVTLKSFTNGPLQIQALGTNDLQFGYIGPGAMWLPASGKAKVAVINGIGNADRLITQKDITSVDQLKGKKVAIPEGTSGDMVVQLALKKAGLKMSDVNKVAMEPSTIVSAFASKQVDAAGIWYPLIDTIKQQVPDLNELAKNTDFEDTMAFPNVIVTGPDYAAKNEDAALKVIKVLREAMDYRKNNIEKTIKLVAEMNKQDEAKVKSDSMNGKYFSSKEIDQRTSDGTVAKWLDAMNDFYVSTGKLKDPQKGADYYLGDLWTKTGK